MAFKLVNGLRCIFQSVNHVQLPLNPLVGASATCRSIPSFDRCRRPYSVWEPEGLDLPPEIPEYDTLNISMRGYDYVTLESFAKFAHNFVKFMGVDNEAFPTPARTCKVQTYKPFSTNVEHRYELAVYERTVQIDDIPSTVVPLLLETLQQNSPEGVNITVKYPDEEEHDFRYVPDIMLKKLESEMVDIQQIQEDRKKK